MTVYPTELIIRVANLEKLKEALKTVQEVKKENPLSSFKVTMEVDEPVTCTQKLKRSFLCFLKERDWWNTDFWFGAFLGVSVHWFIILCASIIINFTG